MSKWPKWPEYGRGTSEREVGSVWRGEWSAGNGKGSGLEVREVPKEQGEQDNHMIM